MDTNTILNITATGINCLICVWKFISTPFVSCFKKNNKNEETETIEEKKESS
jgi:hypothetical protein